MNYNHKKFFKLLISIIVSNIIYNKTNEYIIKNYDRINIHLKQYMHE